MSDWTIVWPQYAPKLTPWRASISEEVEAGREAVIRLVGSSRLTIEIELAPPTNVIPELGMVGHCLGPGKFRLLFDPANRHFAPAIDAGALRRQVVHEAHHCLRSAGPGYGESLGEALVSEGLAGHFVHRLFGTPPEPWESALKESDALRLMPDATALAATDYDHNGWFFGTGGTYPRWLGYTLGYLIVGHWLARTKEVDGPTLVNVAASDVLAAVRRAA